MTTTVFVPKRLDKAFRRLAISGDDNLKSLLLAGNPYYQALTDDFVGAAVGGQWATQTGTGTPARSTNSAAGVSQMKLTTTTTSGDDCIQAAALQFNATDSYFLAVAQLDTIASSKFEIGLSDSTTNAGEVNVKATPTAHGTNFAVFIRDTTANVNLDFMTCNAGTVANKGTAAGTFAAATNYVFEIRVQNGFAAGYVNGALVGSGQVATTSAFTPYFYVKTLTTTARNLSVEYVACVTANHI